MGLGGRDGTGDSVLEESERGLEFGKSLRPIYSRNLPIKSVCCYKKKGRILTSVALAERGCRGKTVSHILLPHGFLKQSPQVRVVHLLLCTQPC